MRQNFVCLIGFGQTADRCVLTLINRRIICRDIFIARVRNDCFQIRTERIVGKSCLKILHHGNEFFMRVCFEFVHFSQFHRMEKRIFNVTAFQRNGNVFHKMRDGRIF